jgi:hypothetical protein
MTPSTARYLRNSARKLARNPSSRFQVWYILALSRRAVRDEGASEGEVIRLVSSQGVTLDIFGLDPADYRD